MDDEHPPSGDHAFMTYDHLARSMEDVDVEIVQLALVCGIHILDRGMIARILHNDSLACDHSNQRAFDKLRTLLMMHYALSDKALAEMGVEEAGAMMDDLMHRLRHRFGSKLGGRPADAAEPVPFSD